MREPNDENDDRPLRVGSLFSGYGGLDLAVEEVFSARTIWFSEINEPVARVFAHHWPAAPNLGDITAIDWNTVEPVDVICGGFPCQDVSTVGKMAGLKHGTRSGLWAHMATAVEALQPEWVVIENVRGLLSATAIRATTEGDDDEQRNPETAPPEDATLRGLEPDPWGLGDQPARPLRALGAVLGDLADLRYDARWVGLPASAIGAPHPRFRIFILARRAVPHSTCLGLRQGWRDVGTGEGPSRHDRAQPSGDRPRDPARTPAPTGGDVRVDRGVLRRWGRYAAAIARWEHITGRPAPEPAILTEKLGPRPAPAFVEWLMGLDEGWVTESGLGLTSTQQLAALGNGVLPRQAVAAIRSIGW
ncbi:DNA (cytosine-5)-methyltransferase 1 [Propionibacterium cyclohexanicum]|uniref:DNA (cytosine-5-)-methyltransferase n=1 Tax=Propionibacterium cyclohexanicum TaxID=64702 RepID=A0A1H9T5G0_9ACTN|nr:DNA cytosine methyltransferase [Propionibacterium cyclohexanicum]SER92452.1 DNA (cytosine-5)-methyltransferase 1 [Propionibacterium cyclohexanicum]